MNLPPAASVRLVAGGAPPAAAIQGGSCTSRTAASGSGRSTVDSPRMFSRLGSIYIRGLAVGAHPPCLLTRIWVYTDPLQLRPAIPAKP